MPDPLQAGFWQVERQAMWEEFNGLIMDTMLQGASNAIPLLPASLQALIDWDVLNYSSISWLRQYRSEILDAIDATTQRQVRGIVEGWIRDGDPLSVLETQLAPIFGNIRAAAIAATEVTRAFAQGNIMLWESTAVVSGKRWMTAQDELVCPFCGPLAGQVADLQANFSLSAGTIAQSDAMRQLLGDRYNEQAALQRAMALISSQGTTYYAPPAHPRCRCYLQPFVSEVLLSDQIGGILAGQFFAEVKAGKWQGVAVG